MPLEDLETLLSSSEPRITRKTPEELGIAVQTKYGVDKKGTLDMTDIKQGVAGVKEAYKGLAGRIGGGIKEEFKRGEEIAQEGLEKQESGEPIEALGKSFAGGTKMLLSPITGLTAGISEPAIQAATKAIKSKWDEKASESDKEKLREIVTNMAEGFENLPSEAKTALQVLGSLVDIVTTFEGGKAIGKAVGEAVENIAEQAPKVVRAVGEGVEAGIAKVQSTLTPIIESITKPKFATQRNDLAESMLNSMIKVDPVRGAEKFYKLSDNQTLGSFLLERDIIGKPDDVINKLADRFEKVKRNFDNAIQKIEGNYQFESAKEILDEMQGRFTRTRDKSLSRVNQLIKKYETEGLNMAENLELKRMYEKKVKTGYLKDNNSELVDRATNLDSEIREDFMRTAEESGFENVRNLSKEIQLTKHAMDSIESKAVRRLVNNQFSLTDNLLLIGGAINPSSLAILGIKKISSSPSVQAKIIKALATNDIKIMKQIPDIPNNIINSKNAAKRQQLFEEWLENTGIGQPSPKLLPEGSAIQLKGASTDDLLDVRGSQLRSVNDNMTPNNITNNTDIPQTIPKTKKKSSFNQADQTATPKDLKSTPESGIIKGTEAKKYKSADEFVKSQTDPLFEFKDKSIKTFSDEFKGKSEVLEAIDDIGGIKNVERGIINIKKLEPTETFSPSNNRVQEIMKEIKGGLNTPIVVEFQPPNFYDIMDGNHRFAAYKELGRSDVPIITNKGGIKEIKTKSQLTDIWEKANPKSIKKILTPKKVTQPKAKNIVSLHKQDPLGVVKSNLDAIYKKAPKAKDEIDAIAEELAKKFGSKFKPAMPPLKEYETAYAKIFKKYKGNIDKLGDVARNTVVVNSADELPKYMKALEAKGGKGYHTKPETDPLGYSGVNMKMTANGIKAEMQVNTPTMIYAKEEAKIAKSILGDKVYNQLNTKFKGSGGKGHKFYKEWREIEDSLDPRKLQLEEQSKKYYASFR